MDPSITFVRLQVGHHNDDQDQSKIIFDSGETVGNTEILLDLYLFSLISFDTLNHPGQ